MLAPRTQADLLSPPSELWTGAHHSAPVHPDLQRWHHPTLHPSAGRSPCCRPRAA